MTTQAASEARSVVEFWQQAGPSKWFAKDEDFDRRFREAFLPLHEAAARGELDDWIEQPASALALVLLLDQLPRNAFRGTPRMYATDAAARRCAASLIERGHDRALDPSLQLFCYLPFSHSESLADQERAVALMAPLGPEVAKHAIEHRDIVERFGRFPHRNAILGRESTDAERAFMAEGGFAG